MDREPRGRLLRGPPPEPHKLEDLGSLLRRVVRASLRRPVLATTAEDGEFPFEEYGVCVSVIPLSQTPNNGQQMPECSGQSGRLRLLEEGGDRIYQGPQMGLSPRSAMPGPPMLGASRPASRRASSELNA